MTDILAHPSFARDRHHATVSFQQAEDVAWSEVQLSSRYIYDSGYLNSQVPPHRSRAPP